MQRAHGLSGYRDREVNSSSIEGQISPELNMRETVADEDMRINICNLQLWIMDAGSQVLVCSLSEYVSMCAKIVF